MRVTDEPICFHDAHYGAQSLRLTEECGDFILRRSDGVYAYQLAVVIDDALMGVTQVVRGCDLLSSTPMQLYLYKLLGDLEISLLRKAYGAPEPIIGLLAYLAGQLERPEPLSAAELLPLFDAAKIPTQNIVVPRELIHQ